MELNPETDLTFTRSLPIPATAVWECWTKPEHIKNFFVPKPHTITDCKINLRVGGRFHTTFDIGGNEMKNEGVYLEIIEGRKLVFTDAYGEGWKPAADPFMTAIIEIEDDGKGGTLYTVTARHRTSESRKQNEDMGFFDGWAIVADQLVKYAQTL